MKRRELESLLLGAGFSAPAPGLLAPAIRLVARSSHPRGAHPVPEGDEPCPQCRLAQAVAVGGPIGNVADIAPGKSHALALVSDGSVLAWGANQFHQLGDGGTRPLRSPSVVKGLPAEMASIASGNGHSLAATAGGEVFSWGWGGQGELGQGDVHTLPTPKAVPLPRPARAVFASDMHSFALLDDGRVMAWGGGYLNYGLLGDGGTESRRTPVPVKGLADVRTLFCGPEHAFAICDDGGVWAWGANADGQLGDGTMSHRPAPVHVGALPSQCSALAAGGSHSAALIDGRVWTWGRNYNGALGDGSKLNRIEPRPVPLPAPAVSIAAGGHFTIAALQDGSVWGWGGNFEGQLGDGTLEERTSPVVTKQPQNGVVSVRAQGYSVVAWRRGGGVMQWGGQPVLAPAKRVALPIAATKFGGRPDLPSGVEWPTFEGKPQAFVAQVNLLDIRAAGASAELPPSRILSFFYAQAEPPGFDPADKGGWAVLFAEDPSRLERSRFPRALQQVWRFPETPVDAEAQVSLAHPDSFTVEGLTLNAQRSSAYQGAYEQYSDLLGGAPRHRLLGHPDPVQGDMQVECQLVTNGVNCGTKAAYHSEEARRLRTGAVVWRLLLQIDSDGAAGLEWGDGGRLYFWIRQQDLANRRFVEAWCVNQQY